MDTPAGYSPETITGNYYFDPNIYARENELIFGRTWQYVGHVSMLEGASAYVVREIADESVIVLRNQSGQLRAFYNVCQHRAHRLLEGEGKAGPLIRCPYHVWGYDNDGNLKTARGTDDIANFDKSEICLTPVRLETMCGFIFVNLDDDADPLSDLTKGLEEEIRAFSAQPEDLKVSNRYHLDLKANWKNSIENFCECYHCPNKHPSLTQNALDLETYKIECHAHFHVHRSRDKGEANGYKVEEDAALRPHEFRSFYIWPNTVFEIYPGGNLTVFHHVPTGPETTEHHIEWYFKSAELTEDEKQMVDFLHVIRLEDVPLCESVQKGLHSRGYGKGRLVIDADKTALSEHAVYDFQQKVLVALSG